MGRCSACPDVFILFTFSQNFSCNGRKQKVLDVVGTLFGKNQNASQVTNPLYENTAHFMLTQMAWLQYPSW